MRKYNALAKCPYIQDRGPAAGRQKGGDCLNFGHLRRFDYFPSCGEGIKSELPGTLGRMSRKRLRGFGEAGQNRRRSGGEIRRK